MRFEVLGTLRVRDESGDVQIGGPMRRRLLAALLCRGGRPVSADELIADLWGEAPPRSAAKTLQSHVVRLRDDLGRARADVLVTTDYGYHLDLENVAVDAEAFAALVSSAQTSDTDPGEAVALLHDALELWRDDAYLDFADASFAVAERLRLAELRGAARDLQVDLELRRGMAATLVPELETRVAAEPYREHTWEQLILSLYRSGRQADALGAYRRVRELLASELGVDPGERLRELESLILLHDPALMTDAGAPAHHIARRDACPYRGLAGYTDRDAALFVGRERLTAELAGLLAHQRVVVVTGPSGSGKSSLLHAGLLPALRGGALPGSEGWRIADWTPRDIVDADADSDTDTDTDSDVETGDVDLVVVDQAEELFLDGYGEARARVLHAMVEAGTRVVLAIRGDFVGRLAELPSLAGLARTTVLVRALRDDEVRRVVVEPAARCGLGVDGELVEVVLDDVSGAPAALPLLAVALVRAWQNRSDDTITLAGYHAGGGIAGALEATAEDVYTALPSEQAAAARHVLTRLATRQGRSWVRRPLPPGAFPAPAETAALAALAAGRLLTTGDDRVEIVHEALLTRWPRLYGWLTERELVADQLEHLATAARSWNATRSPADLYRGTRLQAARDWAQTQDLDELERQFLAESIVAADAELAEARARAQREALGRRRLRVLVGVLAAVLVLALAGGAVAVRARSMARAAARRATQAALSADARRLAASSLIAPDLRTALLLAVAAYRLQDSDDTRSALLAAVETSSAARWRITTTNRLEWLRADAAGDTVWTYDSADTVLRVDVATHRIVGRFALRGDVADAVSPDGRLLAVVGGSSSASTPYGQVIVQDARSGAVRAVLPARAIVEGDTTPTVVFTGDGRWLAVAESGDRDGTRDSARVALFDAHDLTATPRVFDAGAPVTAIAASRHELAVATAARDLELVDPATGHVLRRARRGDLSADARNDGHNPIVALSPDGTRAAVTLGAVGANRTTVAVLSTRDLGGYGVRVALDTGVPAMAFSPTGSRLAVAGENGDVVVADAGSGAIAFRLSDSGPVHGLDWAGDSDTSGLFSDGLDSEMTDWDLSDGPRMLHESGPVFRTGLLTKAGRTVYGVTGLLADPQHFGVLSGRSSTGELTTRLRPLATDEFLNAVTADATGSVKAVSIGRSSDGHNSVSCDLYSAAGTPEGRFGVTGTDAAQPTCVISPDGRTVAVSLDRTRVGLYSVPTFRRLRTFAVTFHGPNAGRVAVAPVQFDPDGSLLVQGIDGGPPAVRAPPRVGQAAPTRVATDQLLARVLPATGRVTGQIAVGANGSISNVDVSPDGTQLAVASNDGRVRLLDARTLAVRAQALTSAGFTLSASFSPDGSLLVSSGTDGTMRFFDARTLRPVGPPIRLAGNLWSAFYSGDRVVGLAPHTEDTQRWFEFPGDPRVWARTACSLAGTGFTRHEWAQYVTHRPFRPLCP